MEERSLCWELVSGRVVHLLLLFLTHGSVDAGRQALDQLLTHLRPLLLLARLRRQVDTAKAPVGIQIAARTQVLDRLDTGN